MKRLIRIGSAALFAALFAGIVAAGPGDHGPHGEHLDDAAHAPPSALARLPDGSVNVPKEAQRRLVVRTRVAAESEVARTLELPGRVIADPNAGGRVQPLYGGRIEAGPRGLPVIGQKVHQGEVLAWVRHNADPLARANQAALRAELRTARVLAEQRVARLEGLEGSIPRKDIDAARAELAGLRERERDVAGGIDVREPLRAPVDGTVARADVLAGQVVEPRETLFEIVDPSRLLIEAVVADAAVAGRLQGGALKTGSGAELALLGAAGSLRDGVLPVLFRPRDQAGNGVALAVGQPVTVVARLQERLRGIVLPTQALTRGPANEQVVWVKTGAERFVPRPVEVQPLDAQTVVVTRGLSPDLRVVVQGASLIAQIR